MSRRWAAEGGSGDSPERARPNAKGGGTPEPLDIRGRLALRPREAAAALGLSERAFRSALPRLPHLRIGSSVLLPVGALQRWLEEQAKAEHDALAAVGEELAARIRASSQPKK